MEQTYRLSFGFACAASAATVRRCRCRRRRGPRRVIRHAVPHRAAAADLPPLPVPGRRGFLHRRILERLRRIAGHRVEAPGATAGHRVVRGEESARRAIAAARADDHFPLGDARRHRDRVVILRVGHARLPHRPCRCGIERVQPSVDDRRDDQPLVDRQTAIDDAAADLRPDRRLIDLRIPAPRSLPVRASTANTTLQLVMP